MINVSSIEFLKSLAQYDYDGHYYDFHNDYSCEKLSFLDGALVILFKKNVDGSESSLNFFDAQISAFEFYYGKEPLVVDSLYRGRVELDGELRDLSDDGKGYFYMEFCEGQRLEFWAKGVSVEHGLPRT